jgi:hypothetical protein
MNNRFITALFLLTCAACVAPKEKYELNVLVGTRTLDDGEFWEGADDQEAVGVAFVSHGVELGIQSSTSEYDDGVVSGEVALNETSLGYRGTHDGDGWRAYLGAGLTRVEGESRVTVTGPLGSVSGTENDESLGIYAHAGVAFEMGTRGLFGFDVRSVSGTSIQFLGFDETDVDYIQASIFIGVAW